MPLPDKTLCVVEGPPWDRNCEPVGAARVALILSRLDGDDPEVDARDFLRELEK